MFFQSLYNMTHNTGISLHKLYKKSNILIKDEYSRDKTTSHFISINPILCFLYHIQTNISICNWTITFKFYYLKANVSAVKT